MLSSAFPSLIHSLKCSIINITRYTSFPSKKKLSLRFSAILSTKQTQDSFLYFIFHQSSPSTKTFILFFINVQSIHAYFLYNIHNKKIFFSFVLLYHTVIFFCYLANRHRHLYTLSQMVHQALERNNGFVDRSFRSIVFYEVTNMTCHVITFFVVLLSFLPSSPCSLVN